MMLSAPGSLLIAGEYRITDPGGRGLALAAGGRAVLNRRTAESTVLRGIGPDGEVLWSPDQTPDGSLPSAAWDSVHPPEGGIGWEYVVDTTAFFDESGRKFGFGSSAVAALLFTSALAGEFDPDRITPRAVAVHRKFQGGRGSGYDVVTSAHGSAGLFTGGAIPAWDPLSWPEDIDVWLLSGPGSVRTVDAIARFEAWRSRSPGEHGALMDRFDSAVDELILGLKGRRGANAGDLFFSALSRAAGVGIAIGEHIGVPADPWQPAGFETDLVRGRRRSAAVKCLGAGNEMMVVCAAPDGLTRAEEQALQRECDGGRARRIRPETRGLVREAAS